MAYLAFDEFGAVQQAATPDRAADDRLSALEWAVVVLARRDTLATLREPGRLSVALGNLFGKRPNPRLADPRLEALRRLAVLTWHDRIAVPAQEIADFLAAGFTNGQYETLRASIRAAAFNKAQRA
ncbi:hypothetical protein [Sphingomonas jeddahensis]|uniref:Uncharacterized protein n=1 Tax=Sphingomonas jeddahensis TaxID=1915074 RepID=A0A1V2ESR3_9SPHN|nr:hypothetical protein [Sphingomonas jeddahensis]ONF95328.1 hypothetical protein SPHI_24200 [Sphingomonas jeddahensis]